MCIRVTPDDFAAVKGLEQCAADGVFKQQQKRRASEHSDLGGGRGSERIGFRLFKKCVNASEIAALCLTLSEEGCRVGDAEAMEFSDSWEGEAKSTARVASPPPASLRSSPFSNSVQIEDRELDTDAPK
jgi:hypothetical protein